MKTLITFSLPILILFANNLYGQESTEVQFLTDDGIKISAGYEFPKGETALLPTIILIHQGGSSRKEWFELSLWNRLLDEGYVLLAYDIRQHGKSTKDEGDLFDLFNNPARAPLDLLAAIKFLEQDTRIDSQRIGIIGASIGANLACVAASSDKYHVKSVVSISAKVSAVQNLSGLKEPIIPKNVFFIASKSEQNGFREKWAYELFTKTTGKKKVEIAKGDKHGSFILRESKSLENSIVEWFKKTL